MSFNIRNTGIFLPQQQLNAPKKKALSFLNLLKRYGAVDTRYWATHESCSHMGAEALRSVLSASDMHYNDIDLLINGSATFDYPIPHKSCLTQELVNDDALIPSIDVGSTCLGFIASCIVANGLLQQGYNKIAIINSEKSSPSLNPEHYESYYLFGDGAAATIIDKEGSGKILASHLINHPKGARHTIVHAGGNENLGFKCQDESLFFFQMAGIPLMKEAKKLLPPFMDTLLQKAGKTMSEIDLIIPHQASKTALSMFMSMFNIPSDQIVINIDDVGNTLSASIPIALHYAEKNGQLKRGMTVMIIGTGAGFSVGGLIIEY